MSKNIFLHIVFLLLLITITTNAVSQKIPDFEKVTLEELKATSCTYDKNAPAEVLIDEGTTSFDWDNESFFRMVQERRIRIKIYNNTALHYADVKLVFLTNQKYERITDLSAYSYNLENDKIITTKLEKKLVYTNKLNENFSEISFAIPNVKAGTIIEYKYTTNKDSYSNIDPWIFQREIPIAKSKFTLNIPEYFRFTSKTYTPNDLVKTNSEKNSSIATGGRILSFKTNVSTFYLTKVRSLNQEPFMNSKKDYLMRMEFQLSEILIGYDSYKYTSNWQEIAKELRENLYFGEQLKKNVSTPELDLLVALKKTKEEKIIVIHNYFRQKFSFDGHYDYYCKNVKDVAVKREGSSGDLNLLFINKLLDYKIDCYPILLSTKDNGTVNTFYPFLKQFNTVMAFIPLTDSTNYVIDASNKYNVYNTIPSNVIFNDGLIIEKANSNWVNLSSTKTGEINSLNLSVQMDSVGNINGSGFLSNLGYSKVESLKNKKDGQNFIGNKWSNIKFNNVKVANADNDSAALETTFDLTASTIVNGNYYLLPLNILQQWQQNPFMEMRRFSDIDFNHTRKYNCTIHFTLPDALKTDVLPKNIKITNEDGTLQLARRITQEDNVILINLNLYFENPLYMANEYENIQAFFTELFNFLDEPIVFLKK